MNWTFDLRKNSDLFAGFTAQISVCVQDLALGVTVDIQRDVVHFSGLLERSMEETATKEDLFNLSEAIRGFGAVVDAQASAVFGALQEDAQKALEGMVESLLGEMERNGDATSYLF